MKAQMLLFVLLLTPFAYAMEIDSARMMESEVSSISVSTVENNGQCTVPTSSIELAKTQIFEELGISSTNFVNLTNSNCWESDTGKNMYMTFIVKDDSSSFEGQRVSVSFNVYDFEDVDAPFNNKERNQIGYTLKNKYMDYLKTETDETYFIRISPEYKNEKYDCNSLNEYFVTIDSEKYFNNENTYCEIIMKTKTSELKNLVSDHDNYVNYFGEEITYLFEGISEGTFNLKELSKSITCSFDTGDEFYMRDIEECHGIYKDEKRFHFSANQKFGDSYANIYIYGYVDGRAKISISLSGKDANKYEDDANAFFSSVTEKFFKKSLVPTMENEDMKIMPYEDNDDDQKYYYFNGEALIEDLTLNEETLNNLEFSENKMNKYYSDDNTHLTISVPYIQLYINDKEMEVLSGREDAKIMPLPYYANDIVITENHIYAHVSLNENDENLANELLNEKLKEFIEVESWKFNVRATGENNYYIMRGGYDESATLMANGEDGLMEKSAISTSSGGSDGVTLNDEFSNDFPEFAELENEMKIQLPKLEEIIRSFLNLFKIQETS